MTKAMRSTRASRRPRFCVTCASIRMPVCAPDARRTRTLVREPRHQVHVHERRLARLVEVLLRHHRVVPVEHFALLALRGLMRSRRLGAALPPPPARRAADGQQ